MTIRDLTDQFEIQGNVTVKKWNEEKETYIILSETDGGILDDDIFEIKYMYAVDNTLVIEVGE